MVTIPKNLKPLIIILTIFLVLTLSFTIANAADFCKGAAEPCDSFTSFSTCNDQDGCRWVKTGWVSYECTDNPKACNTYTDQEKCKAQMGCYVQAGTHIINTPFNVKTTHKEWEGGYQPCTTVDNGWGGANAFCQCKGYDTAIPDNQGPCYIAPRKTQTNWAWDPTDCPPTQEGDKVTAVPLLSVKCCIKTESVESVCDDELDNDCDAIIDCKDTDCDGKQCGAKLCPEGTTGDGCIKYCSNYDCQDCSLTDKCMESYCSDNVDNDNDGAIDCGDIDCDGVNNCEHGTELTCNDDFNNDADVDEGGNELIDCDDSDCVDDPACIEEPECTDSDGDDYGAEGTDISACSGSTTEYDCDDSDGNINPGADEICDDEIDNDCDGDIDADDSECEKPQCTAGETRDCGPETETGACEFGTQTCTEDGYWGDCEDAVYPEDETCNQLDDDCDGIQDNVDGEESVEATQCRCYNDELDPKQTENATNKIDDNCDGEMDANETDADNDGFAIFEGDCDDFDPARYPGRGEICFNDIDDDCNGKIDDGCGGGSSGSSGGTSSGSGYEDGARPTDASFETGNGICENGESYTNACVDCGCPSGSACIDNECVLNNPTAASAAAKTPKEPKKGFIALLTENSFPVAAALVGVLIAILAGGLGAYFFYYKPHEELEEFEEPSITPEMERRPSEKTF